MRKMKHRRKIHNLPGKIITLVGLAVSGFFYLSLWNSKMVPNRYLMIVGIVLLLIFAACFALQFCKKKIYIAGIIISVLCSLILGTGGYFLHRVNTALDKVGGASYKTDNMIAVVRVDDPAESLDDIRSYKIATQNAVDQKNTDLMLGRMREVMNGNFNVTGYESVEVLAQALLDKETDVAVYNDAFTSIIEDSIEDYSDKIKIIYQYEINTDLDESKKDKGPIQDRVFHIYISGIDVYGPISTNSRSDVNIIMSVNPESKQILLTTTPRDYYVEIPEISGESKDKLTHAGIYGVDRSMATLDSIYGINIDYYARVNFTSLIKMVDVLGGIDVNSQHTFSAGGYDFTEGSNHLTGEQALAFARERYSFEDGDNQRGKNQEAVIVGMLQKAMSPAILKDAPALIDSVSDSVETNMSRKEMAALINMQLDEGGSWNIVSANAVGTGDSQSCYSSGSQLLYVMQPDWASVNVIKQKLKDLDQGNILK